MRISKYFNRALALFLASIPLLLAVPGSAGTVSDSSNAAVAVRNRDCYETLDWKVIVVSGPPEFDDKPGIK
jgi:hypothetical protein